MVSEGYGHGSLTLLRVDNLRVWAKTARRGIVKAVDDVSFEVNRGETLGLVGESGSGKTMTGLAVMRLEPANAWIEAGQVVFDGQVVTSMSKRDVVRLRGSRMGMVLQDPMTSLDPSFRVGNQIGETIRRHKGLKGQKLQSRVLESLRLVRMPSPEARVRSYPHQLSGGMRQRATSAIALSCEPSLLIADEPTTALDVTIEAEYLNMLERLKRDMSIGMILISHDLSVVRRVADKVAVMYAGQVVEIAPTKDLYNSPAHPYTAALLKCVPGRRADERLEPIPGHPPDPSNHPEGCRFAPRCAFAREVCFKEAPQLTPRDGEHLARCWGTESDGWVRLEL